MLIGREGDIEQLNGFYEGDSCSVAVVTGSIGVGKSTLLKEFALDKKAYYYNAYETTGKHQLNLIGEAFNLKQGITAKEICDRITAVAARQKVLIIIDQYPNIYRGDSSMDALLFEYVMGDWKDLPVKLILCGDAFVLMEKYVLSGKALWKNSISLKLELKPLGFYDSCKFFKDASPADCLYLYGITGGIPYNLVKVTGDIKADTVNLFLDKSKAVGQNPEQVMATELRELSYYNYMLSALAKGLNRVNQIAAEVDKPKDVVVPYLNSLMTIGICTKDTAITELNNRKKTRYSIVNSSTLFWYSFIAPNYALYSANDVEGLWEKVQEGKEEFMHTVFVKVCDEYLKVKSAASQLSFTVEETGNWWVNDDEAKTTQGFDLVALGKSQGKSATIFCQCYCLDTPIEVAQIKSLIELTKQMQRTGDLFYIVFSTSGFNDNAITISSAVKNIMLVNLDEMK